ncbi:MAG: hypothetical protein K1X64_21670 [Myxococcaceae bacterium]|nr:hypothetical protein [Myxococcaceae bacterium]
MTLLVSAPLYLEATSKRGGVPKLARDCEWPGVEAPWIALLDIALAPSVLPEPWTHRRVAVFCVLTRGGPYADGALIAESYLASDTWDDRQPPSELKLLREVALRPVRLPAMQSTFEDEEDGEASVGPFLLERVPEIKTLLEPWCDPQVALNALLEGLGDKQTFIGGVRKGVLAYLEPEPQCMTCNQPMRFLFQMGDSFGPEVVLGGASYVYGCDRHPEELHVQS